MKTFYSNPHSLLKPGVNNRAPGQDLKVLHYVFFLHANFYFKFTHQSD